MRAARAIAFFGLASLALSLGLTPAVAGEAAGVDTLRLLGTVLILPDEPHRDPSGASPADAGVWLATDEGPLLPLDARTLEEAAVEAPGPGARFEGVVELPRPVAEAMARSAQRIEAGRQAPPTGSELVELAAEAVAETEEPLPVREAAVTQAAVTGAAGAVHQADVAFVAKPGQTGVPGDADLRALVARVSDYWVGQSNGLVGGIAVSGMRRLSTPAERICDANSAWTAAAAAFGRTVESYGAAGSTRHLVVLVLDSRCGAGLGTVGVKLGGGVNWSNLDEYTPQRGAVVGAQTLAHEFGHNFGLSHANVRACTGSATDAPTGPSGYVSAPCTDIEYGDLWNVMGMGIMGYTSRPAALAVNERDFLGALEPGMLKTVRPSGGSSQTLSLNALTADGGVRGLLVVPASGEPFYVEYRNGTGQDAGMPQAGGAAAVVRWKVGKTEYRLKATTGVRVLKALDRSAQQAGMGSTVLSRQASGYTVQTMTPGQAVVPHGGTARATVVSTGRTSATVRVDFADPFLPVTPTISGTVKVGSTLAARAGSWSPRPDRLGYQWLRDGSRIGGATGSKYRLTAKDAGRRIAVRVTGWKGTRLETSTSARTRTVPRVLKRAKPSVSGSARVGAVVRVRHGKWGPGSVKVSYRWLRNGKAIGGATGSKYRLTAKDRGKRIAVRVTGKKSGYSTASKTSAAKRVRR